MHLDSALFPLLVSILLFFIEFTSTKKPFCHSSSLIAAEVADSLFLRSFTLIITFFHFTTSVNTEIPMRIFVFKGYISPFTEMISSPCPFSGFIPSLIVLGVQGCYSSLPQVPGAWTIIRPLCVIPVASFYHFH